jgi:hypothetical protein
VKNLVLEKNPEEQYKTKQQKLFAVEKKYNI